MYNLKFFIFFAALNYIFSLFLQRAEFMKFRQGNLAKTTGNTTSLPCFTTVKK